ncbi:MAG: DUF192 domain-containing protein [Ignavibacteriales bacterium]|nr:DUF192 domain-containing protein [Ignavibacteriales bacterium]
MNYERQLGLMNRKEMKENEGMLLFSRCKEINLLDAQYTNIT